MPSRTFITASTAAVAVLALGAGSYWLRHEAQPRPEELWAQVDKYCIECHNRDDLTADIAFDKLSAADVTHEPEIFEAAIRKLRGYQMPPPGSNQPEPATRAALVRWLEGTLDAAAAAAPNPGRVALHRLNRTEYANAIDDLLGLKVDAAALLPKDDESDGFDNVANVLKVSPSFLEQYISAARVVSELAVGNPKAKLDSRVFYAEPGMNQNFHRAGMPLGTRGGMLVEHLFPADGDYTITLGGLAARALRRRAGVPAHADRHGRRREGVRAQIGGDEDLEDVDLRQAAAVAEINARFENIRVPVTAGPHKVAATFVARTMAESDDVLQPFMPGGGEVGIIEGEESPLKIERLRSSARSIRPASATRRAASKIFVCRPANEAEELPCAKQIVAHLAAPGVPPSGDATPISQTPLQFYEQPAASDGRRLRDRHPQGADGVLASPKFLYRVERAARGSRRRARSYAINDLELASRLSFFLWSQRARTTSCSSSRQQRQAARAARARRAGEAHARRSARRVAGDELRVPVARRATSSTRSSPTRCCSPSSTTICATRSARETRAVRRQHAARGPQRARPARRRTTRSSTSGSRCTTASRTCAATAFRRVELDRLEPLGPARQGRRPDGHVVRRTARRRCCAARGSSRTSSARRRPRRRRTSKRFRRTRTASRRAVRARAPGAAPREPVVQRLPRRDRSARLRARELRRHRRVARRRIATRARRSTRPASCRRHAGERPGRPAQRAARATRTSSCRR